MGKYYAVRKGLNVGIYRTWDECKAQVLGYKGAEYKSFTTLIEAENFMKGEINYKTNKQTVQKKEIKPETQVKIDKYFLKDPTLSSSPKELITEKIEGYQEKQDNKAIAYVDGSYNDLTKEYSYGAIILYKEKEYYFNKKFDDISLRTMRNVAGEIEGSKKAISFCAENDIKTLDLYYDYEGIAKWTLGEWKRNKSGTIAYKSFYDDIVRKHHLNVNFIKVKAHSNDTYNDIADQLAKEALSGTSYDSTTNVNINKEFIKMDKYYAVREGFNVGIYETWDECKKQVMGYKGAKFKRFSTLIEAENFIKGELNYQSNEPTPTEIITLKRKTPSPPPLLEIVESSQEKQVNKATAYVDGSYNDLTKEYSYGAVIFYKGKEYHFNEKFDNSSLIAMRNVAGEIEGSKKAMSFCAENDIKTLDLYYDYEGIAKWALGEWKRNKPGTIAYKSFYDDIVQKYQLNVNFIKVKAHSNDIYNDLADQLAKEALSGLSYDSSSSADTNNSKKVKLTD